MRILTMAMIGSLLLSAAAWAQIGSETLKTELLRHTNAFMDAWKGQDMPRLQSLLAPDFVYVGLEGIGSRERVAQGLTHCVLTSYDTSDVQLHRLGEKVASLVYRLHQQASCEGHPLPPEMLAVDTYVQRADGQWQLSLTSLTPVATHTH